MPNRLADALSPYLLQHADNPVDWWPWCDEAFEEARRRDVPVLLSVGYAACHWCHVMAHESFEDPETAQLMNRGFVNVKVDREERPDVDDVYMTATTAMTGRGGWPMTVFLDHDRRAFYAGTYYPPQPRPGMPSFAMVLQGVSDAWVNRRDQIEQASGRLAEAMRPEYPPAQVGEELSSAAMDKLRGVFDTEYGGFGGAPKFPQPMIHEFLLRHHARTGDTDALSMVETTLTAMAAGGMYDQLAGGFARYSVDARWLVPHFEKMLYDNALLLRLYLHWWRESGSERARQVVEQTADFLLTEMLTEQGCFAASLDADSEGAEGTFYVWTPEQVRSAGADPGTFGVTAAGTFEHGTSVLQWPQSDDWPRERLLQLRNQRPRPARDDKVVLAWNSWAVSALAEAGLLLQRPEWISAAQRCRDALWSIHRDGDQWFRVSRDGMRADAPAVLEDWAAVALAEFTLAAVTGADPGAGLEMVDRIAEVFIGPGRDTVAEDLPRIGPDFTDNATPSGWSLAAEALLCASALTGNTGHREQCEGMLARAAALASAPQFWGHGLSVVEALLAGPKEVALLAPAGSSLHRVAVAGTFPSVIAFSGPLCEERAQLNGADTAYVCSGFVCDAPTTSPEVLAQQVRALSPAIPAGPH